jgi:hypothetical protein
MSAEEAFFASTFLEENAQIQLLADVRFAPDSDRIADIPEGPLCAKSGCEQSQQGSPLFDQLVRQQLH